MSCLGIKRKFFSIAIVMSCTFFPFLTIATEGFYIGILGGANLLRKNHFFSHDITYNNGYAAGGVFGYGFCSHVRVEGEVIYRRNNIRHYKMIEGSFHRGHRRFLSYMVNCLYDFYICYPIVPYLGVGLGVDQDKLVTTIPGNHEVERKTRFAAQGIVGFSYPFYDYVDMSLDYRFHWADSHCYNNTFALTIKYIF